MNSGTVLKSLMNVFTFALLINSCPFSTPPSSRPMMTSTMAISTSVKPDCIFFMFFMLFCVL